MFRNLENETFAIEVAFKQPSEINLYQLSHDNKSTKVNFFGYLTGKFNKNKTQDWFL